MYTVQSSPTSLTVTSISESRQTFSLIFHKYNILKQPLICNEFESKKCNHVHSHPESSTITAMCMSVQLVQRRPCLKINHETYELERHASESCNF